MAPDDLIGPIGDLPGLDQADRDAIMGGNAARLLGLG